MRNELSVDGFCAGSSLEIEKLSLIIHNERLPRGTETPRSLPTTTGPQRVVKAPQIAIIAIGFPQIT